jgi:hypothetical protein
MSLLLSIHYDIMRSSKRLMVVMVLYRFLSLLIVSEFMKKYIVVCRTGGVFYSGTVQYLYQLFVRNIEETEKEEEETEKEEKRFQIEFKKK